MRNQPLTPALMNKFGILKRFHNAKLTDYYGSYPSIINMKKLFYSASERELLREWKQAQGIHKIIKFYIDNLEKAKDLGKGIFMYGNCGTGKSLLLMCIAREALARGMRIKVVSAQGLINLFAKSWDANNELNFESSVMKVPFLFIEEMGKEHMTSIALPTLTRVVKYREEAQLPTCFTCNEDFENIQKSYSPALASAILGTCKLIHFDSKLDWRNLLQESWQKELEA